MSKQPITTLKGARLSEADKKPGEKMSMVDVGWLLPGRAFVGNPFDFCRKWLHEHYSTEPGSTRLGDREGSGPQPLPNPHFHLQPNQLRQNPLLPNTSPPKKMGLPVPEVQIEQGPRGEGKG